MNSVIDSKISSLKITKKIVIDASAERVFEVLTNEISLWWGEPYLRNFKSQTLILEPKLGGKFYESWAEGGMILGEVIELSVPHRIVIRGSMGIEGLIIGVVSINLESASQTTILNLEHSIMGELPPHLKTGFDEGWDNLIGVRLKAWVEEKKSYGLGKVPPPGTPKI